MIPTNLTTKEVCSLALKHRLYVSGWCLHSELSNCGGWGAREAAIYLSNGIPVGVAVIASGHDIQVFVRKSQRRKGIGRKLVEHMRAHFPAHANRMDGGYGIKGSLEFWKSTNVPLW